MEYGPHRFSYKGSLQSNQRILSVLLQNLLGIIGGFGQTHKGGLPTSKMETANCLCSFRFVPTRIIRWTNSEIKILFSGPFRRAKTLWSLWCPNIESNNREGIDHIFVKLDPPGILSDLIMNRMNKLTRLLRRAHPDFGFIWCINSPAFTHRLTPIKLWNEVERSKSRIQQKRAV